MKDIFPCQLHRIPNYGQISAPHMDSKVSAHPDCSCWNAQHSSCHLQNSMDLGSRGSGSAPLKRPQALPPAVHTHAHKDVNMLSPTCICTLIISVIISYTYICRAQEPSPQARFKVVCPPFYSRISITVSPAFIMCPFPVSPEHGQWGLGSTEMKE